MADDPDLDVSGFRCDYAASNRSTCNACRSAIDQGALRMGPLVQSPKGDFKYPQWHHWHCFAKKFEKKYASQLADLSQISGMDKLKFEDQMKIKNLVVAPAVGDAATGAASSSAKPTTDEEKAVANMSKAVWAMREKLEALSNGELAELLDFNDQPHEGKIFGGRGSMLERCADGMTFGAMPKCSSCGHGDLRFTKGKFRCTGAADEFARCEWVGDSVACVPWKVSKGLQKAYDFLGSYKYKPGKERASVVLGGENPRVNNNTQPTDDAPAVADGSAAETSAVGSKRGRDEGRFEGMTVCCVGKLKMAHKDVQSAVEAGGGTFSKSHVDADVCVMTAAEAGGSGTQKGRDAVAAGCLCVSEAFITASAAAGQRLTAEQVAPLVLANGDAAKALFPPPAVAPAASQKSSGVAAKAPAAALAAGSAAAPKSAARKYIVKGSGAVDPASGLAESGALYENPKGTPLNAIMNLTDVTTGRNSYYVLQVIESSGKFFVFRKWGRVGDDAIGDQKLDPFSSASAAQNEFQKVYFAKTGNHWADRANFKKMYGKFQPIDIDYSSNDGGGASLEGGDYRGPLDKPVRDFISLIFDIKVMQEALKELEIDTTKMPLGKLSKATIGEGFKALKQLQALIDSGASAEAGSETRTQIVSLTNRFYTYIPHVPPESGRLPLLDSLELIKAKSDLLEALQSLEISSKLVQPGGGAGDASSAAAAAAPEHPIDQHYKKLNTNMRTVARGEPTWTLINDYLQRSHGPTHNMYSLEIVDLFEVSRNGEDARYAKWTDNPNRMLLWHGSRITNWGGILSQGLRIAPPEAPTTGYMFGKGVYFADVSSKSANYCFTTSDKTTGVMMLCEVALGDMKNYKSAFYVDGLAKPYLSVQALGKHHPDPKGAITTPEGYKIPCGKCIASDVKDSTLLYNEYIVYDVSQIKCRYVLRLDFKYNKKMGTFF